MPSLHHHKFSNSILSLCPAISFPFSITSKVISGTKVECWVRSRKGTKSNWKAPFSSNSQKVLPSGDHREAPQLPKGSVMNWPFLGHPKEGAEPINWQIWRQSPWNLSSFSFGWSKSHVHNVPQFQIENYLTMSGRLGVEHQLKH